MDLENLYYQMLRIRLAEEKLIELWHNGEIRSLMHLSTGQEAVAVGVCAALTKGDSVVSTHRCHAHYLAKGGSIRVMYAELAGKASGCCAGRGGSMHLFAPEMGMNLSLPLVGGTIPIAVGIAQAIKMRGECRVSVAFFGDGAVEEGVFWESLNFAVVHKLPMLFVCENNLYATHSHIENRQPSQAIVQRVTQFKLPASWTDGNDVRQVFSRAQSKVEFVRQGGGPAFIEAKTYRWKEHWGPGEDTHLGYRSAEELAKWKQRCPLKQLAAVFGDHFDYAAAEQKINAEIEEAIVFAKASPEPQNREASEYANA